MVPQAPTVGEVLLDLARRPYEHLIRRWNWKSAVTSALIRASIFFTTNLAAGLRAAVGAMLVEFAYRGIISGFYGSVIQSFRRVEPPWAAAVTTMSLLPLLNHTTEFTNHWLRGTPKLAASITASVCFTALSTSFNFYAMRRGFLVVGSGQRSLWADLAAMPRVMASFIALGPLAVWRLARRRSG